MFDILISFAPIIFFVIAFAYSSVGLGGASSYTAIMVVLGFSYIAIPTLSLTFNIIVTALASFHFIKNGYFRFSLILPFLVSSMPMSWLGGMLEISEEVFTWILLVSLLTVIIRIYFWSNTAFNIKFNKGQQFLLSLITGGILGFIAGIVGIGGGIYLVPLILLLKLGTIKEAAAAGAIFVFLNSFIGVISRMQHQPIDLLEYSSLFIAISLGGLTGSFLGSTKFSPRLMEKILGSIVVVAFGYLVYKILFL